MADGLNDRNTILLRYKITSILKIILNILVFTTPLCTLLSFVWDYMYRIYSLYTFFSFLVCWGCYAYIAISFKLNDIKTDALFYFNYPFLSKPQKIILRTIVLFNFLFGLAFIILTFLYQGGPGIRDGQYVIVSHGTLVQTISFQEYRYLHFMEHYAFAAWFYDLTLAIYYYIKNNLLTLKNSLSD